jgi:hypothetical protein
MDGPAGQGVEERDVAGALVGSAHRRVVVGGADADEHGADVLVAEVELDLLERPLDEERGVGVHDRAHAGERQSPGDADHRLLADADVEDAVRVAGAGRRERGCGDVGGNDRELRVVVQRGAHGVHKGLSHGHSPRIVATTTFGPSWRAVNAACSAS